MEVILFVREGCPECEAAKEYLEGRELEFETIVIDDEDPVEDERVPPMAYRRTPSFSLDGKFIPVFNPRMLDRRITQ